MDAFRITGGAPLMGKVRVTGAKNAVLPILAASMLLTGTGAVTLRGCPYLADTQNMLAILQTLGCEYAFSDGVIRVCPGGAGGWDMPDLLSKKLRSSIFMLGPLIGRFRKARVTYPGGCDIGQRPIDLHLKGLRALGVEIREEAGRIYCDGEKLRGGEVFLDLPSVGATENVMMAAALAPGHTLIHNAAREPEITDLQNFINAMGGRVRGGGTADITIDGVEWLSGCDYAPMPDRITAGTLMAACAMTGGEITVENAPAYALSVPIAKLRECGCQIDIHNSIIYLRAGRGNSGINVETAPYPGFPTDLQAQFMALCCTLPGTSLITENMFENRFSHARQLRLMGADITLSGKNALVLGGKLSGADVRAGDLRGGAALTMAGLAARGVTLIRGVELIDRGYERLESTLASLGADIVRVRCAE